MNENNDLSRILKEQRKAMGLTLTMVSEMTGVSTAHLGRIEKRERFPSAHILRKIAKPLGFDENYLFTVAGFLSPTEGKKETEEVAVGRLDPFVARELAHESTEIQRFVLTILQFLKLFAKNIK